jgi:hypothetical protein
MLMAAVTVAGCQNRKSTSTASNAKQTIKNSGKLEARLTPAARVFTKDSISLAFTVINNADTAQRFCKWETPFEPRIGKYFEITDDKGNEAPFRGAVARRKMPPPPESYISVPAHDSVRTLFNLADKYTFKTGQYLVKYSGGGVSGLETMIELKITVAEK